MKVRFEDAPGAAEQSRGLHVDYVAAKRNIPAWRWNLIVLLLLSPALYFLGSALLDQVQISAPAVVELKESRLHPGRGGQVVSVLPEGTRVVTGTLLAILAPLPPSAAAPAPPRIAPRPGAAAGGRLLAYRRERARRYQQLWEQGAATQAELASALAQLAEAEAAYGRSRRETVPEPPGPRPEKAEPVSIAAPHPGVVAQVAATVGDWVAAGAELVTVVDDREARIVAFVNPRHVRYAEAGRAAHLRFPDGTSIPARVTEVRVRTARPGADHDEPFRPDGTALQVVLAPAEDLPQGYRRQGLPLEVSFDFTWPGLGKP